ncbi:hypothetical protein RB195_016313 [Necator americanus]
MRPGSWDFINNSLVFVEDENVADIIDYTTSFPPAKSNQSIFDVFGEESRLKPIDIIILILIGIVLMLIKRLICRGAIQRCRSACSTNSGEGNNKNKSRNLLVFFTKESKEPLVSV